MGKKENDLIKKTGRIILNYYSLKTRRNDFDE